MQNKNAIKDNVENIETNLSEAIGMSEGVCVGETDTQEKSVLIKIPGKGGKQPAALQRDEMLKGGADLTR